ncbi:MAG: DUF481 domain-containing protein [Calditrichaceae bacterium]
MKLKQFNILFVLSFIISNSIHGQTIVNTEKLAGQTAKGFNAGLEFNFDFEQGNSDLIELSGNSLLGYRKNNQSIKFMTGVRYLSEEDNELIFRNFIHLRHNYYITKSIRSFAFYQLQKNNSLLLKRRQLFGAGLRKVFTIMDSLNIDAGSGLMYEMEKFNKRDILNNENASQSSYRMANILSIRYKIKSNISILNTLYFQPDISDFNDFRFFNELSLSFAFNELMQFNIASVWRHDSQPPHDLKRNDINIQTGIVMRFHMSD